MTFQHICLIPGHDDDRRDPRLPDRVDLPTMGCFFGLAFKKYGMPLQAIVIGEFVINIIFFGFIAMGAPTAIQDVITGLALLIIITLTTKAEKGEIVK